MRQFVRNDGRHFIDLHEHQMPQRHMKRIALHLPLVGQKRDGARYNEEPFRQSNGEGVRHRRTKPLGEGLDQRPQRRAFRTTDRLRDQRIGFCFKQQRKFAQLRQSLPGGNHRNRHKPAT